MAINAAPDWFRNPGDTRMPEPRPPMPGPQGPYPRPPMPGPRFPGPGPQNPDAMNPPSARYDPRTGMIIVSTSSGGFAGRQPEQYSFKWQPGQTVQGEGFSVDANGIITYADHGQQASGHLAKMLGSAVGAGKYWPLPDWVRPSGGFPKPPMPPRPPHLPPTDDFPRPPVGTTTAPVSGGWFGDIKPNDWISAASKQTQGLSTAPPSSAAPSQPSPNQNVFTQGMEQQRKYSQGANPSQSWWK